MNLLFHLLPLLYHKEHLLASALKDEGAVEASAHPPDVFTDPGNHQGRNEGHTARNSDACIVLLDAVGCE